MVSNRHHSWSSPRQTFPVNPGKNYVVSIHFKLLNLPTGHAYAKVIMILDLTVNGHHHHPVIANMPLQRLKYGWTEISGDFHVPNGTTNAGIYLEIPDTEVNFLLDAASAMELPHNPHWLSDATHRIDTLRKAPVSFKLHEGVNEHGIAIENHINFDLPMNAVSALRSHGLKVRGHNMFWGVDQFVPQWLKGKSRSELLASMKKHVHEVISRTTGKGIKTQALRFKNDGIPVYGLGLEGHFYTHDIDMDVLKYRLDKIAESGLKLWITAFTLSDTDNNRKAANLEKVMTLLFSHPAVEGILLWGF
nr:endo-1,4-beta-xylanase 2 isoform X1 [Crassostrea gigas]XP_034317899.1 endo-1,4-beta-xylanase 2 isoform X1 [Crassostrea gigas]XP_034317900.1 endo-1,4-beta-xylanase 2 isoform X1 [Crassostrea gigas]